ncbi:MAG TPA: WD40 repeat domain-containing protein, partial [Polyangiaceae bacterium]|nr:WD40 repeat domain-containing protein [Polyangiaceae bacterium]
MLGFDPAAHALRVMWSASVGDYITALDVDSTGELLALGTDSGEVCVFDVTSSALRTRVTVHDGGVLSAKWSPTQRLLATSGQDGSLRLQDSDGNERCRQPSSRWIERLAWSPDGTRLAAASGSVVRIFDAEGRAMLATETHPGTVTGLAWNRRGNQFASACLDGVRIFHGDSPTRSRGLRWRVPLVSLSWSPNDAIIAAVTEANTVHFWRLPSGRDAEIAGFPARPRALAWDPASHFLATSGDAKVAV